MITGGWTHGDRNRLTNITLNISIQGVVYKFFGKIKLNFTEAMTCHLLIPLQFEIDSHNSPS